MHALLTVDNYITNVESWAFHADDSRCSSFFSRCNDPERPADMNLTDVVHAALELFGVVALISP